MQYEGELNIYAIGIPNTNPDLEIPDEIFYSMITSSEGNERIHIEQFLYKVKERLENTKPINLRPVSRIPDSIVPGEYWENGVCIKMLEDGRMQVDDSGKQLYLRPLNREEKAFLEWSVIDFSELDLKGKAGTEIKNK